MCLCDKAAWLVASHIVPWLSGIVIFVWFHLTCSQCKPWTALTQTEAHPAWKWLVCICLHESTQILIHWFVFFGGLDSGPAIICWSIKGGIHWNGFSRAMSSLRSSCRPSASITSRKILRWATSMKPKNGGGGKKNGCGAERWLVRHCLNDIILHYVTVCCNTFYIFWICIHIYIYTHMCVL